MRTSLPKTPKPFVKTLKPKQPKKSNPPRVMPEKLKAREQEVFNKVFHEVERISGDERSAYQAASEAVRKELKHNSPDKKGKPKRVGGHHNRKAVKL